MCAGGLELTSEPGLVLFSCPDVKAESGRVLDWVVVWLLSLDNF